MELKEADRLAVIALRPDELTKDFIEQNFITHFNTKTGKRERAKYPLQAEFILKKGEYINTENVKTNVGQFVVNKVLFGNIPNIQKVLGYVADEFSAKAIRKIENILSKAMMNDLIEPKDFADYLNNLQWLGNTFNAHVAVSFTPKTCMVLPEVKKKRAELFKKYDEELKRGDAVTAVRVSKEMEKMAEEALKNDPGMNVYKSGCKPKFGNQYRAMFISQGPVWNPATERFEVKRNSFMDGLTKEDIPIAACEVINGAWPKCLDTAVAGYETKKLFACYQGITVDKHGSDCGSKHYREVLVTDDNKDRLFKRYYLNGKKEELLTKEVIDRNIGKFIKIRSPLYCANDTKICNKCAGELPYILGITNIGLTSSSIGSDFLNLLMKAFHDTTVNTKEINIDTMIIE